MAQTEWVGICLYTAAWLLWSVSSEYDIKKNPTNQKQQEKPPKISLKKTPKKPKKNLPKPPANQKQAFSLTLQEIHINDLQKVSLVTQRLF